MKKIYHYTDLNGLKGIIENHSLWATNMYFLNDAAEMHHGISAFENALKYLGDELNEHSIRMLHNALDGQRQHQARHNYNISFCQHSDLLSQWRGYAGAQGVSLEFDSEELKKSLAFGNSRVISHEVFYTDPESTLEAKAEIVDFVKSEAFTKNNNSLFYEFANFSNLFNGILPFFKHRSFSEESEYRIVIQPESRSDDLLFRINQHGIIPYLNISVKEGTKRLPLKCVKIGPCKNKDFVAQGIEFLLNCNGYKDTLYSFTEAPFRV